MKMKRLAILSLLFVVAFFFLNQSDHLLAKKKKKIKWWKVNVHFVVGIPKTPELEKWIYAEIAQAERMYNSKPKLKINPKIVYESKRGGKKLAALSFKNGKKFHKYMDKHFDHVAKSKTSGYMRVLITGSLTVDGKRIGGKANFPHSVVPFSRKHGPALVYPKNVATSTCKIRTTGVLAHELGHIFGLKHTWEHYATARCNKDYKKGKKHRGKTVRKDGKINLMDYNRFYPNGCPRDTYLNKCQRDRAAKKRRKWMTRKGKVKYKKLRGMR